jgi:hypothetical protein
MVDAHEVAGRFLTGGALYADRVEIVSARGRLIDTLPMDDVIALMDSLRSYEELEDAAHTLVAFARYALRYVPSDNTNEYENLLEGIEAMRVALLAVQRHPSYVYDRAFGDDRVCTCGHPYYRHFDTYERMAHVGCKYCACYAFQEATNERGA